MDGNDVSKRTVLVLLVLTVLVSVVGTWTVLNSLDSSSGVAVEHGPVAGEIRLNVKAPAQVHEPGMATGNVVLSVNPR